MRRAFIVAAVVGTAVVSVVAVASSSVGAADKPKTVTADGVTLIDQSMITAAGGPDHITEPGSYRLASNLTAPPHPPTPDGIFGGQTEAIINDASDVSLDSTGSRCPAAVSTPTTTAPVQSAR
jgi:hypothetical protein